MNYDNPNVNNENKDGFEKARYIFKYQFLMNYLSKKSIDERIKYVKSVFATYLGSYQLIYESLYKILTQKSYKRGQDGEITR